MLRKITLCACLLFLIFLAAQEDIFSQDIIQKAVMIIASNNFRDEELLVPKDMLEASRIKVVLASSSLSPSRGMLGTVVKPDILLQDVDVQDYDAVIFVGGSGAKEYWDDPVAHDIVIQAKSGGKIIAAICIAPVILARAGIMQGVESTAWPGVAEELEAINATFTGANSEEDHNIITANGPEAAEEFGEIIVRALVRRR